MKFFLLLLQMIPAIIRMVKEIESVIPDGGLGATKLDLVLNTVETAAQESGEVAKSIEGYDLKGALKKIIDRTVRTFNDTGVFKSTKDLPPVPQS